MKLIEPPSHVTSSNIVFIGRNSRDQQVAQEQNGLFGGLFVNRAQAVKYALFENGHHPETIIELSRGIELDMSGNGSSSATFPYPAHGLSNQLRVAGPFSGSLEQGGNTNWQC